MTLTTFRNGTGYGDCRILRGLIRDPNLGNFHVKYGIVGA